MRIAQPPINIDKSEEISSLIETWFAIEQRLVELTGGEVDSVVSHDGRTLLFGRAQEQLRAQDAVRQAAMLNELRVLFDLVPAMIWFKDTKNGFVRVNQKVTETTGLRVDEIEGKTAYDIFPEEADAYYKDDLEVIESGRPKLGIVETLPGLDGEIRWVQTDKVPVCDHRGKVIGLVALVHDITARMKSEAAVVESEKRYRSLFENILEGYAYCKTIMDGDELVDFTYEEVNGAFGMLTGLTDVVGRSICEILPGFRESNRAIMECYSRVVLTGSPEKIEAFVPELESWLSITVYSHERSHFVAVFDNITARKVSSSMLRDSEQRLALAKDAVNMGIWDWDIKRNKLDYDAKMYALYGIDPDAFGGVYESWQRLVHPEDVSRAEAEIADALSNVKEFHTDYRIILPDGQIRHVEAHAQVLRDSEGRPSRMIGFNLDISARKQAEESLRLLGSAVEQSKESIVITDANLDRPGPTIVFVNPGFTQMTGFTAAEAVGQTPRILQGPQTDPEVLLRLRRCLERGEVFSGEAINYKKDGTPFWLEWQIAPIQDAIGKTSHYVAIQRDVTERKEIETALRDSEERFREMLNNVELLAMILDLDGNVTFCNNFLLRVAGWDREEVLGNDWFSMFVSPTDKETLKEAFHTVTSETLLPRYETTIVTRTGQKRDIVWNSSLLKDASGNLVGLANIGEDVTERKSLQEQLLQSQKMESLGSLAGGVAHDFNNLLTGMLGYTELIQMDLPPDSQAQADLEEIRKSAMQAARMTKQLLSFARKDVVERLVVDLNELVTNLEGMTRRLLGVDIRLSIHLQKDLGSVKLDPSQFEQLVLNLSVNARDAMPNGGSLVIATGNVTVDQVQETHGNSLQPGQYVVLTVSDNGCGIPKDVQSRVFDPFFTTKEKGKGTGLGLSTCYGIVANSGGQIRVYSEIGIGTTFHIYFPRVDEAPTASIDIEVADTPGNGETILLVEDEDTVRTIAEQILTAAGYRVLCAADGVAALKVVATHKEPIDLLLSDVIMPGMTGPELSEVLEKVRPEIKVLYMSGFADDAILRERTLEKAFSFIQKPFSRVQLARKVRQVIDKPTA